MRIYKRTNQDTNNQIFLFGISVWGYEFAVNDPYGRFDLYEDSF